jgi:hypothetical protein
VLVSSTGTGEVDLVCSSTEEAVFELPHSIEAPARARALVERHLCPAHGQDALAAAQLLVTELATCAVLYGKPPVRLGLDCGITQLKIAVTHRTVGTPVREIPLDDGVLHAALIAKLTRTWGIERTPEGRELWCCLPTGVLPSRSERGPTTRSGPVR